MTEYNGMQFHNLAQTTAKAVTASLGIIDGKNYSNSKVSFLDPPLVSFQFTANSRSYMQECIISSFQYSLPVFGPRTFNKGYARNETIMTLENGFTFALTATQKGADYFTDNPVARRELSPTDTVFNIDVAIRSLTHLKNSLLDQNQTVKQYTGSGRPAKVNW